MAFSKTPVQSTYETKRIQFFTNPEQRQNDFDKDFRLLNLMVDFVKSSDGKKAFIKNRPGLEPFTLAPATGEGRGIFWWERYSALITVVGNTVYFNNVAKLVLTTSTGTVGMAEHIDQDSVHTLLLVDGINGYVFDGTGLYTPCIPPTWTASTAYTTTKSVTPVTANGFCYDCTVAGTSGASAPTWPTTLGATVTDGTVTWKCRDNAFPTPHIPQPIFLDGYMFLAKASSADIQNSQLNFPHKWDAGNYTTAEMYPDNLVGLAKNNNMIYGVGSQSIQFFYDAGTATGSPLENNPGAVLQFGCPSKDTIVQTEDEVVLLGNTGNGGHTVWKINGFKAKEISTPAVCTYLDQENNLSLAKGTCIRVNGQKLYIVSLELVTLVYNFTTDLWSYWSGPSGNFTAALSTDSSNGAAHFLDKTNGRTYRMSTDVYTDNGVNYPCVLTTQKLDFDTINRKTMSRLTLIADVPGNVSADQNIDITWSDDDYRTFVSPRSFKLNGDLPSIRQLGDFRRRAFRISYSLPFAFRMEGIEVDINKGIR